VLLARDEGSILLCENNVCAPWHKVRQGTKEAPTDFAEFLFHALG
jgi:hypothetical protein